MPIATCASLSLWLTLVKLSNFHYTTHKAALLAKIEKANGINSLCDSQQHAMFSNYYRCWLNSQFFPERKKVYMDSFSILETSHRGRVRQRL